MTALWFWADGPIRLDPNPIDVKPFYGEPRSPLDVGDPVVVAQHVNVLALAQPGDQLVLLSDQCRPIVKTRLAK